MCRYVRVIHITDVETSDKDKIRLRDTRQSKIKYIKG